ncbi:MAG: histidine kinase [Bacteroidales bacterium]|nr:histidine kinase [Bacteroidales bacterium]
MYLFNYRNKAQRIVTHIMFWLAYIFFFSVMSLNPMITFKETIINGFVFVSVDIFATYVVIYFLIPYFLKPRKYLQFILLTILLAVITILLNKLIQHYIYIPIFHPEYLEKRVFWQGNYWYYFVSTFTVVIFGAGVKLVKLWVQEQQNKTDSENQKIKSELLLLKSQLNPHFLFNTLNNIDSLIVSNPQKASESIIRLSDILRYVTYNTKDDLVTIEKEEESLRSFIELNILRFGNNFISYDADILNPSRVIAPMLLIPLVENAIKHGDKKAGLPAIQIILSVNEDITFTVVNAIPKDSIQKDAVGGVGIANLKRRLELIYPNAHHFEHKVEDNKYIASLWIR